MNFNSVADGARKKSGKERLAQSIQDSEEISASENVGANEGDIVVEYIELGDSHFRNKRSSR